MLELARRLPGTCCIGHASLELMVTFLLNSYIEFSAAIGNHVILGMEVIQDHENTEDY